MPFGNFVLDKGLRTSSALTKYYAVKFDSANAETVTAVTGATDAIAGFVQFGVSAAELLKGKGASVRMQGITPAIATGAISTGALVTLAVDGRVTNATSGNRIVGTCVGSPAVNANDQVSILVETAGQLAP